jgi:hypothetical protein
MVVELIPLFKVIVPLALDWPLNWLKTISLRPLCVTDRLDKIIWSEEVLLPA